MKSNKLHFPIIIEVFFYFNNRILKLTLNFNIFLKTLPPVDSNIEKENRYSSVMHSQFVSTIVLTKPMNGI